MSGSRDLILGNIRRSLNRGHLEGEALAAVQSRLRDHPRHPLPERSRDSGEDAAQRFIEMAEKEFATVDRVASAADVPKTVSKFLASHNLPMRIAIAPDPRLDAMPWDNQPLLERRRGGAAKANDEVTLTHALAGAAETGTLMMPSGPNTPTTLNLLAETCIICVRTYDVVGGYEDAWDRLRAKADESGRFMPRNVMMVTGPSRTADIEQTIELGVHGPRRLHIVMVDGD